MKRRTLDIRDFDGLAREAESLCATGYQTVGNWNLSQVCEHLAIVMEGSLDGFRFPPASWFWRRLLGPALIRLTVWTWWMPRGLQCPDPSFAPSGQLSDAAAVARFQQACRRVRDWTGSFHPHPILGRVTPDHWRRVHLIHGMHHLNFLIPTTRPAESPVPAGEACARCANI